MVDWKQLPKPFSLGSVVPVDGSTTRFNFTFRDARGDIHYNRQYSYCGDEAHYAMLVFVNKMNGTIK